MSKSLLNLRQYSYPALSFKIQIIRLVHFKNSSANDEGRALAARWRAKMCHGGFPYSVSHLLISANKFFIVHPLDLKTNIFSC
jgi:hypothetical protein